MDISLKDDLLDSRNIEERIEELEGQGAREEWEEEELKLWLELRDEVNDPEWEYGLAFIRDDYFAQYARDTAADFYGKEIEETRWPFTCIDWEEAASQLQQDYSSVEIDSTTYWYRA